MHPIEAIEEALGIVPVKVTNLPPPPAVRETHFDCTNFLLNIPAANLGPTQILQLDPLRYRATIILNGAAAAQVILCHSNAAAQKALAGSLNDGALITLPYGPFEVDASGPLWAVPVAAAAINVSVIAERKDAS